MNIRTAKDISTHLRKTPDIIQVANNVAAMLSKQSNSFTPNELLEIGLSRVEAGKDYKKNDFFDQALKIAATSQIVAECYFGIAVTSRELKELNKASTCFTLALDECEKFKLEDEEEYLRIKSYILKNRGIYYLVQRDNQQAAEDFNQSIFVAQQSPSKLRGFIPSATAYYALALCKTGRYSEGFWQFEIADQLYCEYPKAERLVSMDYALFFVLKGRVYLELNWLEKAIKVLEKGYQLRFDNLQTEKNAYKIIGDDYVPSRMGAVKGLLEEARKKLVEKTTKPLSRKATQALFRPSPKLDILSDLPSNIIYHVGC